MHMERPDDVGREAGIGRTRSRDELKIFRACPCWPALRGVIPEMEEITITSDMFAPCLAACYLAGPRFPKFNVATVVVWTNLGCALVVGPPGRLETIT